MNLSHELLNIVNIIDYALDVENFSLRRGDVVHSVRRMRYAKNACVILASIRSSIIEHKSIGFRAY